MNNEKQLVGAALRTHLSFFIQRSFAELCPADTYLKNWHIEALAYALEKVAKGETKRLIITMPPRHLKSISASVAFPAWLLGLEPSKRIFCASYAQELSTSFSLQTRTIMQSEWYKECFPNTALGDSKNTQNEITTTQHGGRLASSVGGSMTGKGGDIIIIDGPQKADEALSEVKRKSVVEWLQGTAATRLNNPKTGAIIIIQQRCHEEDLSGHLLEQQGWEHLNLPAIAEVKSSVPTGPEKIHIRNEGDILHPERMSKADLDQRRSEMGGKAFAAQYQQQPAPVGDGIIEWDWFPRYSELPGGRHSRFVIQSWDTAYRASEISSYSVCLTFAYYEGHIYLIDVFRERISAAKLLPTIRAQAKKYGVTDIVIEATGGAACAIEILMKERRQGRKDVPYVQYHKPKIDKAARLMREAYFVEQGLVHLPKQASWLNEFRQELLAFPAGKHDDQVDALSQALKWLRMGSERTVRRRA